MWMLTVGAWVGEQLLVVAHWGGPDWESELDDGCCVAHHSWSGTAELCVCCIRSAFANWNCASDKKNSDCKAMELHESESHARWWRRPREWEDVDSLMLFWKSAVAADGVEHGGVCVGSWYSSCGTLPSWVRTQTKCICNSRFCCEFVGWVAGCDDYLCESRVVHE